MQCTSKAPGGTSSKSEPARSAAAKVKGHWQWVVGQRPAAKLLHVGPRLTARSTACLPACPPACLPPCLQAQHLSPRFPPAVPWRHPADCHNVPSAQGGHRCGGACACLFAGLAALEASLEVAWGRPLLWRWVRLFVCWAWQLWGLHGACGTRAHPVGACSACTVGRCVCGSCVE